MAVQAIANLVQNIADQSAGQTVGQTPQKPAGANPLNAGTASTGSSPVPHDTFSPSSQATAQDAGIFQVSAVALAELTANKLSDRAAPITNQVAAPPHPAPAITTHPGPSQPAAAVNSGAPIKTEHQVAATPATQAATSAASAASVRLRIQALNTELPATGLTNAEIQRIDTIATQFQNFNPATYLNLVNQFELGARQPAQQSATNASIAAGSAAATNAPPSANVGGQSAVANTVPFGAATSKVEQAQTTPASGTSRTK
jgi:hypothetical protein